MTASGHIIQRRRRVSLALWGLLVFAVAWYSGHKIAAPPGPTIRVYDIRDLLVDPPNFDEAPHLGISPMAWEASSAPATAPAGPRATSGMLAGAHDSRIQEIVRLIRDNVEPQSWEHGAGILSELGGRLVITQTPQAHAQIQKLLHDLLETRQVQITVEARFLWLDDVALATLSPEFRQRLTPRLDSDHPADAAPLTGTEFNILMNASQASQGTTTMTCPRITLFNGQRAYVLTSNQRAYVAGVTETRTSDGQAAYKSDINVANSGILLDVQAAASADRQSVTLSLRPELALLLSMESSVHIAVPGGKGIVIQHPVIEYKALRTTVTVPQGKTYLIGGFRPSPSAPGNPHAATQPADARRDLYLLLTPRVIAPAVDPNARVFPRGP